ncbi:hypothetical protein Hamer_G012620 [Homarus americanus]|uniref:Uncharacterized protein n=1 Tax=Homarus americanus TaxID=6706 RepID=A0A8J5MQJ4_HOMAM|nr:hypothetical protein Hamer_G012620 [Homarus americanus]
MHEESEVEIKAAIEKENAWAKNKVDYVKKFTSKKGKCIIKIQFKSAEVAEKATKSGLLAFTYNIPYHQKQQEQYHHTRTCLRCYAIEDHDSVNCPKPREYKICSKCSSGNIPGTNVMHH